MSDPFDRLGAELDGAAARLARRRAPWWRERWRLLLAALAGALGLGAVGVATGALLSSGAPVGYRYGSPPTADRHYGVTVLGSVKLLTTSVHDPAGGLPWGLRSFRTSRGYGCIQVGRVQDGKLGVLALERRGGGVLERGRFHELRPAVLTQATTCAPLDGAGHVFFAIHQQTSTDGVPPACSYVYFVPHQRAQTCKDPDQRTIDAGLLGPQATRISYRDGSRNARSEATLGDVGAYLIVRHQPRPPVHVIRRNGRAIATVGEVSMASSPSGEPITRVDYRNDTSCTVRWTNGVRGACPDPPGFVPVPQPRATDVRAAVRAFATANRRAVRVRFTARAAVTSGRSDYRVLVRAPSRPCAVQHLSPAERKRFFAVNGRTCPGDILSFPLDRDVRAGERIRTTIAIPNIGLDHRPGLRRGRYVLEVRYRVQAPNPGLRGNLRSPGYLVGRAHFRAG